MDSLPGVRRFCLYLLILKHCYVLTRRREVWGLSCCCVSAERGFWCSQPRGQHCATGRPQISTWFKREEVLFSSFFGSAGACHLPPRRVGGGTGDSDLSVPLGVKEYTGYLRSINKRILFCSLAQWANDLVAERFVSFKFNW